MAGSVTKKKNPPAVQAGASPLNGVVPPAAHRFQPGKSGNPAGRPPSAGSSVREHLNRMAEMPLEAIMAEYKSPKTSAAAKIAARTWLDAMSEARNSSGSPIAGSEFDRILDRTLGKPTQAVDVTSEGKSLSFAFVVATPDADPDQDPA